MRSCTHACHRRTRVHPDARPFFAAPSTVRVPIGDDAAVVRNPARESVLCCDPVIEGVHFDADTDRALVGRKVVNRNLADLAAMGAVADWLLVSLVLPHGFPMADLMRLMRGIRAAARAAGCSVVGGDIASSNGPLVVTVTAVGHCRGRVLQRNAAREGDAIHVTAPLGGSRLLHHLRFIPPLAEGQRLARAKVPVRAAMDISDGLLLDLQTMLTASGLHGAELVVAALPVSRAAKQLSCGEPARAVQHALQDGEDHALLFTVEKGRRLPAGGPLTKAARRPIGRILATKGLWLVHPDGGRERVAAQGWEHGIASD